MNATPLSRCDQAEREELARLLPAAGDPELSPSRHLLLKEHLMNTVADHNRRIRARRPRSRRTLALRIALPAGLAAAGIAIAASAGHPAAGTPHASHGPVTAVTISAAGYTLQSSTDHTVTLTVVNAKNEIDLVGLQRDLDRVGAHAHVYAGDPTCNNGISVINNGPALQGLPGAPASDSTHAGLNVADEGRATVLKVTPDKIPADDTLYLYFPLARTSPADTYRDFQIGMLRGTIPTCLPAQTYTDPFAAQETKH
ncbi:hypothetical protein [Streptacidiphilus carbonis]|uniref:hypothetical protein n=1 Tax=Streptacidiphilus carbonis TaxID=105422 RepID=UPI0005AA0521|nr:hypothetical protein [Streptacidiphilus carbonis]